MLIKSDIQRRMLKQPGCEPCGKPRCQTCPLIIRDNKFTSNTTKETFPIKFHADCQTNNIIYLIQCQQCGIQYVGQSGNSLNTRMRSHVCDIKSKTAKSVPEHFTTVCKPEDLKVIIISLTNNDVNNRTREEDVWIGILATSHPFGLNIQI